MMSKWQLRRRASSGGPPQSSHRGTLPPASLDAGKGGMIKPCIENVARNPFENATEIPTQITVNSSI